jgi:hypothetical protein
MLSTAGSGQKSQINTRHRTDAEESTKKDYA